MSRVLTLIGGINIIVSQSLSKIYFYHRNYLLETDLKSLEIDLKLLETDLKLLETVLKTLESDFKVFETDLKTLETDLNLFETDLISSQDLIYRSMSYSGG
jgi:predicted nuclease with TOPRIM domain